MCTPAHAPAHAPAHTPAREAAAAYRCSWVEACKAADYVLSYFGDPARDRGIWVWYCRHLGLTRFLDLAEEVIACVRQCELKYPIRAFQKHLQEAYPHPNREGGAS